MSLRAKRSNLVGAMVVFVAVSFVSFSNLFACPSGQSCPAGKDCVADSSLCVADSSSSTTSSGSSTEPTVVKDQLGLTFTVTNTGGADSGALSLSAGGTCTFNCTFQPSTVGIKTDALTVTGTPAATTTFSVVETGGGSLSAGGTCTLCVTFDPQNAPTPSLITFPLTR